MILTLYIIGAIVILITFIAGVASGSFIAFFTSITGGIVSAIVFFALAQIIDNQNIILNRLYYLEDMSRKTLIKEKRTCPKCSNEYDATHNSCPHCGNRD